MISKKTELIEYLKQGCSNETKLVIIDRLEQLLESDFKGLNDDQLSAICDMTSEVVSIATDIAGSVCEKMPPMPEMLEFKMIANSVRYLDVARIADFIHNRGPSS